MSEPTTTSPESLFLPANVSDLKNINLPTLKATEVGLNLLLLKIAQREAQRINKLADVVNKLEDAIFDPAIIEHLTPAEQIQRYQLALQSTQGSSNYIKSAITSINWSDIETKIMILEQENQVNGEAQGENGVASQVAAADLQTAALRLLQQLGAGK